MSALREETPDQIVAEVGDCLGRNTQPALTEALDKEAPIAQSMSCKWFISKSQTARSSKYLGPGSTPFGPIQELDSDTWPSRI